MPKLKILGAALSACRWRLEIAIGTRYSSTMVGTGGNTATHYTGVVHGGGGCGCMGPWRTQEAVLYWSSGGWRMQVVILYWSSGRLEVNLGNFQSSLLFKLGCFLHSWLMLVLQSCSPHNIMSRGCTSTIKIGWFHLAKDGKQED